MSQMQVTKQRRTVSAQDSELEELLLALDPRDPDITRAKDLQRRQRWLTPASN